MELAKKTAAEVLSLMHRGDCSSADVVASVLDSIDAHDGEIGAYLRLNRETAFRQAEESDRRRGEGRQRPLEGLPVAVKDNISVAGDECTCGSAILKGYVSPFDATAVARLRAAGAVLLGRTNMDEFGMGSTTENSGFQLTRNPRDRTCVPGGSSGGSAAAVAADEAIAALGSDTGGSLRLPASFCGCVGVKPSYGRVSRYGLTAYASSLDQIGPLTKSVEDAALLMGIIAGPDPKDSSSVSRKVPDYRAGSGRGLEGMKVGVPAEYFQGGIDPEVQDAVKAAVRACRQMGAREVEVRLPHTEYAISAYYIVANAEASANLARFDGVRYGYRQSDCRDPIEMYAKTRAAGFGKEVKRRIILGTYALSSGYYDAYYLSAQKVRTLIRRDFEQAFEQCDVILGPVAPTPPYKLGERVNDPLQMYMTDVFTVPASLAGICGVSVPGADSSQGLPIGVQILGPAFEEAVVFRVAAAYQNSREERSE